MTTSRGAEGFDCFAEEPPLAIAEDAGRRSPSDARRCSAATRAARELGRRARTFAERHHSPVPGRARLESVYEEAIDG